MDINDWIDLNPKHTITIIRGTKRKLRAVLTGGDGIDRRLVGEGDTPDQACAQAVENRKLIAEQLA